MSIHGNGGWRDVGLGPATPASKHHGNLKKAMGIHRNQAWCAGVVELGIGTLPAGTRPFLPESLPS